MALRQIRLERARTGEARGRPAAGCALVVPLTDDGGLEAPGWRARRGACPVHRFWADEVSRSSELPLVPPVGRTRGEHRS